MKVKKVKAILFVDLNLTKNDIKTNIKLPVKSLFQNRKVQNKVFKYLELSSVLSLKRLHVS